LAQRFARELSEVMPKNGIGAGITRNQLKGIVKDTYTSGQVA